MSLYVGVLLGAGPILSHKGYDDMIELLHIVFTLAAQLDVQDTDESVLQAAETLTKALEDSECTNTGRGSELNINGKVECDALMILRSKHTVQAAVGAMPHIANPISLCKHLVSAQLSAKENNLNIPVLVSGMGAYSQSRKIGLPYSDLETPRARKSWMRWSTVLYGPDAQTGATLSQSKEKPVNFDDTIGLILIKNNRTCVCSSSGGPLLKAEGRIGPAAIVGAGGAVSEHSAAVCSGCGEDINSLRLADASLSQDNLSDYFCRPKAQLLQRNEMGVLKATIMDPGTDKVLFEWHNSTPSMVTGIGKIDEKGKLTHKIVVARHRGGGGHLL